MADEPIDLMSAVQAGVFSGLEANMPAELAQVFDTAPQDFKGSLVLLGAIESSNEGRPGEQRERFEVEVHAVYQGKDRSKLLKIMHAARIALDEQPIAADGADLSRPTYLAGAADTVASNGVTYAGLLTFEIFAEPA
jgi:hypothetical protein